MMEPESSKDEIPDLPEFRSYDDNAELISFLADPDTITYVGSLVPLRHGFRKFSVYLEYIHFPPGSGLNGKLMLNLVPWPKDSSFVWACLTLPKEYQETADKLLVECGLKKGAGIAMVSNAKGEFETFPANTDNIFFLENVSGHPIYGASFEKQKEIEQTEDQEIQEFLQRFDREHPDLPRQAGYDGAA